MLQGTDSSIIFALLGIFFFDPGGPVSFIDMGGMTVNNSWGHHSNDKTIRVGKFVIKGRELNTGTPHNGGLPRARGNIYWPKFVFDPGGPELQNINNTPQKLEWRRGPSNGINYFSEEFVKARDPHQNRGHGYGYEEWPNQFVPIQNRAHTTLPEEIRTTVEPWYDSEHHLVSEGVPRSFAMKQNSELNYVPEGLLWSKESWVVRRERKETVIENQGNNISVLATHVVIDSVYINHIRTATGWVDMVETKYEETKTVLETRYDFELHNNWSTGIKDIKGEQDLRSNLFEEREKDVSEAKARATNRRTRAWDMTNIHWPEEKSI